MTDVLVTDVLLPATDLVLGTITGLSVVTLLLDFSAAGAKTGLSVVVLVLGFSATGAVTGVLAVKVLLPLIPKLLAPV